MLLFFWKFLIQILNYFPKQEQIMQDNLKPTMDRYLVFLKICFYINLAKKLFLEKTQMVVKQKGRISKRELWQNG